MNKPTEEPELLLTPEEEKQVETELSEAYLGALKSYKQSEGFAPKPKMPTLEDMIRAKLKVQLAKVKQRYELEKAFAKEEGFDAGVRHERKYGQKRLDRPALREIVRILRKGARGLIKEALPIDEMAKELLALYPEPLSRPKLEKDLLGLELVGKILHGHLYLSKNADMPKLLALYPDIEVAKREERERIQADLKPLMAEALDISDWSFVQEYIRNLGQYPER